MTVARIIENKIGTVITAAPGESFRAAAERLARHDIGMLVVVDAAGAIAGMVVDADVVRTVAAGEAAMAKATVRDMMTPCTLTCTPESSEAELMEMMSTARVQYIPVVSSGRLVGVVSLGDVVRLRITKMREVMAGIERQAEAERFTAHLKRRRSAHKPAAIARAV